MKKRNKMDTPNQLIIYRFVSSYVGNLNPKVNDALLYEVFVTAGQIESCKIIKDKVVSAKLAYTGVIFLFSFLYRVIVFFHYTRTQTTIISVRGKCWIRICRFLCPRIGSYCTSKSQWKDCL